MSSEMTVDYSELVGLLTRARRQDDTQSDNFDAYWKAVGEFHRRPEIAVFQAAQAHAISDSPREREIAADILGRLGTPTLPFRDRTLPIILTLLEDSDLQVVESAISAAGHLGPFELLEALSAYVDHDSADLRLALAQALGGEQGHSALMMLATLSADSDPEVRSWATFAIGTLSETDNDTILRVLVSRLRDQHAETRGEALLGLAYRKDPRVFGPLLNELESEVVGTLAVEAASELADPRLYPILRELTEWWDVNDQLLALALDACITR